MTNNELGKSTKKESYRGRKALAALMLPLALAACGNNDKTGASPDTTTQTTEATPSPLEEAERMMNLSRSEFLNLTPKERAEAVYPSIIDAKKYTGMFVDPDNEDYELLDSNPSDIASPDNSGQEILNQFRFCIQNSMTQSEDRNGFDLDKVKSANALASCFYNNPEGEASFYHTQIDWVDDPGVKYMDFFSSRYQIVSESELNEGVDSSGNSIQYKDISYTTSSHQARDDEKNPVRARRFVLVKIDNNYDSSPKSTSAYLWMHGDDLDPQSLGK